MGKRLDGQSEEKKSFFKRIAENNKFILAAFACSAFVMIFVFYCFGLFPFGNTTILRMDLYHQYGPLFAELYDRITGMKSFLYSWNSGLGSCFLGNYYNYLASPLSLIVVFFGHSNIPEAIAALILLKCAFASAAFAYYLKRSQGHNDYSIAAFGVLYSFCGFFIAYYWNVMWLDAMAVFPIAMLGIELIIEKRKFGLYVFALTYTMISNYYMAYMLCLFTVLFYIISYFSRYSFSSCYDDAVRSSADDAARKKPSLGHRIRYSTLLGSGFTLAFSGVISVCLAAFALIPVYFILKSCSATADPFPKDFTSYYKIFDFLANHLANVEPTIRSSGTDVLPNVYCGIATIILVPLYLFTKSVSVKEKVAHVGLLGILYFSFNINYANFIWHGFHFPNDLPYRFSFMYSFILLIIAYKAFTRLKEFKAKEVLGAGIAVIFAIILIQKIGSKNVDDITVITSICFTALYTLLFALRSNDRFPSAAFALLMLCSFTAEVCIADTDNYPMNILKSDYNADLADFQALKSSLDEQDGGFYRMELTDLLTRMDPCWYNYNGVSTFSSMAYEKVSNLQRQLGMMGNFINSYTYNPQTPVYNMMNSLKYIVNNNNSINMNPTFYKSLMSKAKYTAYENLYYLPIGFCTSSNILSWQHSSPNPFDVQSDFFERATGIQDVFTQVPITGAEYSNVDEIYSGFDTGDFYFYRTVPDTEATVTFIITPDVTQSCYIYVESANVDTLNVIKNGVTSYHSEDHEAIIDLGVCEAGQEIRVEIPIASGNSGDIDLYAYGLDFDKFADGYSNLKSGQLKIEKFEETDILGSVTTKEDCVLYTSIPYDKGWKVNINGKAAGEDKIVKVGDAMLGIKLAQGTNTIELNFMPTGLVYGICISAAALAFLIFLQIIRKILQRLKRKPVPVTVDEAPQLDLPPIKSGSYSYASFAGINPEEEVHVPDAAQEPENAQAENSKPDSPAAGIPDDDEPEIVIEEYDDD